MSDAGLVVDRKRPQHLAAASFLSGIGVTSLRLLYKNLDALAAFFVGNIQHLALLTAAYRIH